MKLILATIAGLLLATTTSAMAQTNTVARPYEAITDMSLGPVQALLTDMGVSSRVVTLNSGQQALLAKSGTRDVIFRPNACRDGRCAGLYIIMPTTLLATQSDLNQFMAQWPPLRASIVNNNVVFDRYVIADYGIARGSLQVNIGLLASAEQRFNQSTGNTTAGEFPPLNTVAAKPSDKPAEMDGEHMTLAQIEDILAAVEGMDEAKISNQID